MTTKTTSLKKTAPKKPIAKKAAGKKAAIPEQAPAPSVYGEIMASKERYKRWFDRALKLALVSGVLNIILIISLVLIFKFQAPPKTFAVTNDFRVLELPGLEQEYYTDARLTQWAMQTVPEVLSLDFDKWRLTLDSAQDKFSPRALQQFVTLLKEKGWLDLVQVQRLLIHCGVTSPPVIAKRWVQDGRWCWEVQMPVVIAIDSTQGQLKAKNWNVRLVLERCSTRENPRGVWIKVFQII